MLVFENTINREPITSNVFNVINVPIINLHRFESLRKNSLSELQSSSEKRKLLSNYRFSNEYFYVGIYEGIVENEKIFDELKEQNYSFGIAEFEIMAGSFAVFEALGIKKTFNVAATVFFPKYLQLLEIDGEPIDVKKYIVPEFDSVEPGDWDKEKGISNKNSKRYRENLEKHKDANKKLIDEFDETDKLYEELYNKNVKNNKIDKPSKLNVLFKNINYHFINQHPLGILKDFPKLEDKIMYIGGIVVEKQSILTKNKVDKHNLPRVVYASLGSFRVSFYTKVFGEGVFEQMIAEFQKHNEYIFKARFEERFLPKTSRNIVLTEKSVKQQNILAKSNTKLFISHCGLNGLNEAMYAGVPLICVPRDVDQPYNASLIEHKGIGIYVKLDQNFENAFKEALDKILNKNYG
uniref:glucuronosyltransferase n=1 Tax=Meloidogyne hapla TaxID=6305 RepID=A0A1I8BBJ8_MELHA